MPLLERSWALQKRSLALRAVHLTPTEVFWECNETAAYKSFPKALPLASRTKPEHLEKVPLTRSMWSWIVDIYSECQITNPMIAGLAQQIHEQTGDQYVTGIWRKELELQLFWVS